MDVEFVKLNEVSINLKGVLSLFDGTTFSQYSKGISSFCNGLEFT